MPVGGAILGGAALTAGAGIWGASTAANAQKQAATTAANTQENMFNTATGYEAPFISTGQAALPTLLKLLTPGADVSQVLSQMPGYQFAQQWGNWGATSAGTTRGLGGNVLTAAEQYAEGLANNTYGTTIGGLQNLVNTGSGAANALSGNAVTTGANVAGSIVGGANAQAGANIAAANAVGGAGNAFSNYALLSQFLGGNKGMYGGGQVPAWQNPINTQGMPGQPNG